MNEEYARGWRDAMAHPYVTDMQQRLSALNEAHRQEIEYRSKNRMTHRIIDSNEAEWTPAEKVWASVQQFDPRRGSWRGHVIAVAVGFLGAIALIAIGI